MFCVQQKGIHFYAEAGEDREISTVQINENGSTTEYTAEQLFGIGVLNEDYTVLSYPWKVASVDLNTSCYFTVWFTDSSSGGDSEIGTKDIKFKPWNGDYKIVRNGTDVLYAYDGVESTFTFNMGEELELTFIPKSGKTFASWNNYDYTSTLSSSNPYTFTVSSSTPSGIKNSCGA